MKIRWVSEREFRRERCLSWFTRIAKATATGIAMVIKVQRIQAVLLLAKFLIFSDKYIGIGTITEVAAMSEIVKGKPREFGHLQTG